MADSVSNVRHVVGVMTGTSIDGIDAAMVRITGHGLAMTAQLVRHASQPFEDIGTRLRLAADQQPMTAGDFARLAWDFGLLHAEVIGLLCDECARQPDLICIHGQTIYHQPPYSWQLVNPAPIGQQFSCAIVSDLRQADLAAGGQGAPITPIADWILFRDAENRRAIINLGGFCNVTILPRHEGTKARRDGGSDQHIEKIRGFDVCACNQVLDAVARAALGRPFDMNGDAARAGAAKPQAAAALHAILDSQRRDGRSLGTGDEAARWVEDQLKRGVSGPDLAASAVEAVSQSIASAVLDQQVDELIVAGGGARNLALIESLRRAVPQPLTRSDDHGVPIEARESIAFAVLGALCADGIPITLPQVTNCGVPAPQSGSWSGVIPTLANQTPRA